MRELLRRSRSRLSGLSTRFACRMSEYRSDHFLQHVRAELACGNYLSPENPGYTWQSPNRDLLGKIQSDFPAAYSQIEKLIARSASSCPSSNNVNIISREKLPSDIRHAEKVSSVAIGGLSAQIFALYASEIHSKSSEDNIAPPVYVNSNILHANLLFSARQMHARYARRMGDDMNFSGLNMLWHYFRSLVKRPTLASTQRAGYYCVSFDEKSVLNSRFLEFAAICLENEFITVTDAVKKRLGFPVSAAQTISYAQSSQAIMGAINRQLRGDFFVREGGGILY